MNRLYPLLLEHHLPVALRYMLAGIVMLVCAVLENALQMTTGYPGFFLLLPGVFISGLVFNRGSGVLAAILAVVTGASLSYGREAGMAYVWANSLFAAIAVGTALVAECLRIEMKRVMAADKNKALLLREMAHRTKNNLAVLGAMIRMQAKNREPAVGTAFEATARRIQVMAEVYDHLSLRQDSRLVNMRYFLPGVVEKIFQSLAPAGPIAFEVESADVDLTNSQALAIGIIVNELITNSLKYAFPEGRAGNVAVRLSVAEQIELTVSDNGVGRDQAHDLNGRGSKIILLLSQQLGGRLAYERTQPGLCVRLKAPRASGSDG